MADIHPQLIFLVYELARSLFVVELYGLETILIAELFVSSLEDGS